MTAAPIDVLSRFESWVVATPDAVAVVGGDATLSYVDLDRRADVVATLLRDAGAQPGDAVGIFMERRADLVAVLLGTWKAGCAYVPFDPADPPTRVNRLLTACSAGFVIGDAQRLAALDALADVWSAGSDGPVHLSVEHLGRTAEPPLSPLTRAAHRGHGSDLAYLLFTSGTTGDPKAVAIEHRSVANLLMATEALFSFTASDRYLAASTIAFDISVSELFLPLVTGGSLLLRDRTVVLDPRRLAVDVVRHHVTVMQTGPSVWQTMLREVPDFPRLRVAISTGEAVSPELAARLSSYGDQVWNMYGPTETTVWATAHRLSPTDTVTNRRPGAERSTMSAPIGQALHGLDVAVVDEDGHSVREGELGELAIGGVGVARGYVGNAEYSAERFAQLPDREGRWYRTGDVVASDSDGVLQYFGRNDDQLKIRGIRVEPSEVEGAMTRDERVTEAAATWFETNAGTRSIVAAVVLRAGASCTPTDLHAALALHLPAQLIPSRFVFVERIPMTTSGKVDRRAIREAATMTERSQDAVTPELSETEQTLAAIWVRLLRVDVVFPDDHFFTVGGDSLGAVQMIVEAEAAFGLDLPVQTVFEAPTLRRLASRIDALRSQPFPMTNSDFVFPLVEGDDPPMFFCGANLVVARQGAWTVPCGVYVVSNWARGVGFVEAGSVEALARTHVSGVRRIQPSGPYRIAGFSFGGLVAIEIARQLHASGEEIELLFLLDPMHPRGFVGPSGKRNWPSEAAPMSNKLNRRFRRFAEGPKGTSPKKWLEEVFPYERVTSPIIQWAVYHLVHEYGRHPNPVATRLLPHDRWPGFWYAAKRMVREYEPDASVVPTLAVFGRSGFAAPDAWMDLLGSQARIEVVDAGHADQWSADRMAIWMTLLRQRLAAVSLQQGPDLRTPPEPAQHAERR